MALQPLSILKNWFTATRVKEANWDELKNSIGTWASLVNNYLKQIGLDLDGTDYNYNGQGRASFSASLNSRVEAIEAGIVVAGTNIGLDVSATNIVRIFAADGTDLSTSNTAQIGFNSSSNAGRVITRSLTANQSLTLTGAHWGLDTTGDTTDTVLWLLMIDTGSAAVLGVAMEGGREFLTSAECTTTAGSVNARNMVYTASTISADSNVTQIGWIKANFDDTGNAGGENYWTIQTGKGDINFGIFPGQLEGTFIF